MSEYLINTIAAVRKLGIDPSIISVDNIDIEGYDEVVFVDGQKVVNPETGEVEMIRREWPSLEAALSVLEPYLIEMHERGEL